jgi:hypothetical protein
MMPTLTELDPVVRFDDALLAVRVPANRARLIRYIVDAVDDLNAGKASRLLLAARRMTCLYALLTLHGLKVDDPEAVVSDRFIELLPDGAWEGESIILLDDTRFTGRTMRDRKLAAERLVGATGKVDDRVALELGDGSEKPMTDAEVIDLHNQFAMAFGRNLLPFFTDFAISRECDIDATLLSRLLASSAWKTVDVTNSVLAGSGARSFSLFPTSKLMRDFQHAIGDAAHLIEIAKIRVFVDDKYGRVRVRVVPIVLTRELAIDELQNWLRVLNVVPTGTDGQTAVAAGVVSMMLSRALFQVFAGFLSNQFGFEITEDRDLAVLAMGAYLDELAQPELLGSLTQVATPDDLSREFDLDPVISLPKRNEPTTSHYVLIGDDSVIDGYRVLTALDKTTGERTSLPTVARKSKSNLAAASVAVDVLNDLGYSVPTFQVRDGVVLRAYRRGEASVRFKDLSAGILGGRLASIAKTVEVPDEELAVSTDSDIDLS